MSMTDAKQLLLKGLKVTGTVDTEMEVTAIVEVRCLYFSIHTSC
jgi:hypothetical protein